MKTTVILPEDLNDKLDARKERLGIPKTSQIRRAVAKELGEIE